MYYNGNDELLEYWMTRCYPAFPYSDIELSSKEDISSYLLRDKGDELYLKIIHDLTMAGEYGYVDKPLGIFHTVDFSKQVIDLLNIAFSCKSLPKYFSKIQDSFIRGIIEPYYIINTMMDIVYFEIKNDLDYSSLFNLEELEFKFYLSTIASLQTSTVKDLNILYRIDEEGIYSGRWSDVHDSISTNRVLMDGYYCLIRDLGFIIKRILNGRNLMYFEPNSNSNYNAGTYNLRYNIF